MRLRGTNAVPIRETINEHQGAVIGGTIVVLVLAGVVLLFSLRRGESRGLLAGTGKAFFSDDDGASYFVDSRERIPPFEHNGKQAVGARVYTCDGGQTKFVGYLERYTPPGKQKMEQLRTTSGNKLAESAQMMDPTLREVKTPKGGTWTKAIDRAATTIITPKCPGGQGRLDPVIPE
jgi:hypothetical protein